MTQLQDLVKPSHNISWTKLEANDSSKYAATGIGNFIRNKTNEHIHIHRDTRDYHVFFNVHMIHVHFCMHTHTCIICSFALLLCTCAAVVHLTR